MKILTLEVGGVGDEVFAGAGAAVLAERTAGPATAKGGVEHDRVVEEVLLRVARVVVREQCVWRTPCRWVGVAVADVIGDRTTRPEPHRDTSRVPEVRIHTASLLVELVAERVAAAQRVGAARVVLWCALADGAH